jgi:hypothetical protein
MVGVIMTTSSEVVASAVVVASRAVVPTAVVSAGVVSSTTAVVVPSAAVVVSWAAVVVSSAAEVTSAEAVPVRVRKVVRSVVKSAAEVVRMTEVANDVSAAVVVVAATDPEDWELIRQGPALTPTERATTPAKKLVKIIVKNVVITKLSWLVERVTGAKDDLKDNKNHTLVIATRRGNIVVLPHGNVIPAPCPGS